MEKRKGERFILSDLMGKGAEYDEATIEFDADGPVKGKALDITQKGLGFEIRGLEKSRIENIIKDQELFLKLYAGNDFILTGVKIKWTDVKEENGETVFRGGTEINVISPDDNLKLSDLIKKIRNSLSV